MRVRLYFIRESLAGGCTRLPICVRKAASSAGWMRPSLGAFRKLKRCRTVLRSAFRQGRIETANNAHDLCEGDFLVLPSGEPHELTGADSASAPPVPLISLLAEAGVEPEARCVIEATASSRHGRRA